MQEPEIIQGRVVGPETIALIRQWLAAHPDWNRSRLSRELCAHWDWVTPTGQLKDMACRTLLLKLERRGLIVLPPRQRPSPNARRNRSIRPVPHAQEPIHAALGELLPIRLAPVHEQPEQRPLFKWLLSQHHYLGLQNTVGENVQYLAWDRHGRVLAGLLFGSAAWATGARDEFIGWDGETRKRNLWLVTNNTRFLILPWVRVPHLASHVLARTAQRIGRDWTGRYGHPVHLLETFVDRARFRGTCYRAANWVHVGATTGRTRNDRRHRIQASVKDVYVYPLTKRFRERLTGDGSETA